MKKTIRGTIIGGEKFLNSGKQALQILIENQPYKTFKKLLLSDPKVEIKLL